MMKTLPLLLLLAACGTGGQSPAPVAVLASNDSCNSRQFIALVGAPIGVGSAFLESGATYRVIYPGDAVTLDFDPARINVNVDDQGLVKNFTCG
ncbi:MAG: I78 family peptidase inhibitor [Sulfitobacter sp.]